jgi:hypothetical protein
MFPSWYATPGKVARNAGGAISARWMGMTPHAPCTPNCTQNAPAARPLKVLGMIHKGMKTAVRSVKVLWRERVSESAGRRRSMRW